MDSKRYADGFRHATAYAVFFGAAAMVKRVAKDATEHRAVLGQDYIEGGWDGAIKVACQEES